VAYAKRLGCRHLVRHERHRDCTWAKPMMPRRLHCARGPATG